MAETVSEADGFASSVVENITPFSIIYKQK
jgi:hypothetical protein